MKRYGILLLGVFVFSAGLALAMDEVTSSSRTFDIALRCGAGISPSVYVCRAPGMPWSRVGACEQGDGVRYNAEVSEDGVYYYTAKAGGTPSADEVPQAQVLVDTTRPIVELLSPLGGQKMEGGATLRVDWIAADRHFQASPVSLSYSTDDGMTWKLAAEGIPNNGHYEWKTPAELDGAIRLRVSAVDLAGNRGEDMTRSAITVTAVPKVVTVAPAPEMAQAVVQAVAQAAPIREIGSKRMTAIDTSASTAFSDISPMQGAAAQVVSPSASAAGSAPVSVTPSVPSATPGSAAAAVSPMAAVRPSRRADAEVVARGPLSIGSAADEESFGEAKDAIPATKNPELDGNTEVEESRQTQAMTSEKAAYISYIMAGNLVRQGRFKDSLRYYRTAVDTDPKFDESWNDMALIYKQIGAYTKADACIVKALELEPENHLYVHNRGEIHQSLGLALQERQSSEEELAKATDCIHFAVKLYGKAIEIAQRSGRLAECAPTFFRLGEVCYFGNQDPVGAREYWMKVLSLHTPTPELDDVMHNRNNADRDASVRLYRTYTEKKVQLETWQGWAQAYLNQLNRLEQQVNPQGAPVAGELPDDLSRTIPAASTPRAAPPAPVQTLPGNPGTTINPSGAGYGMQDYYTDTTGRQAAKPEYMNPGYGQDIGELRTPVYAPPHAIRPGEKKNTGLPLWKRIFGSDDDPSANAQPKAYTPLDSSTNGSATGYMPYAQR